MNEPIRVLIVEDQEMQRKNLQEFLERRGVEVWGAGDVATARSTGSEHGSRLDVVVLDMRLEDTSSPGTLGSDIGFEIRKKFGDERPEFLILSAHPNLSYYRNCLRLGAAAYIKKPSSLPWLVCHIRALALRRKLAREHPEKTSRICRIAETSETKRGVVYRFCREVLMPSFEEVMGLPFVLFLSDREGVHVCGDPLGGLRLQGSKVVENIASYTFGNSNMNAPFLVQPQIFSDVESAKDEELLEELAGGAFVVISETRDYRLLLGVLRGRGPLSKEDPSCLTQITARYCLSSTTSQIMSVLSLWMERSTRRKAMLAATSRFCLQVGQEQGAILDRVDWNQETLESSSAPIQLKKLSEELCQAGYLLAELYESSMETPSASSPGRQRTNLREVIEDVWSSLADAAGLEKSLIEFGEGQCAVEGDLDNLRFAVFSILQWLVSRPHQEREREKRIRVRFGNDENELSVSFEDSSRRLPQILRNQLFLPFSDAVGQSALPPTIKPQAGGFLKLYLAKTLLELRNGGHLEDRTDEREEEDGHCFVMSFPQRAPTEQAVTWKAPSESQN